MIKLACRIYSKYTDYVFSDLNTVLPPNVIVCRAIFNLKFYAVAASVVSLTKFLSLLLRKGRWQHSGTDPNVRRDATRQRLMEVIPDLKLPAPRTPGPFNRWLRRHRISYTLLAQAAFIKSSLRLTGGHLTDSTQRCAYIRIPRAASTSLSATILGARYPAVNSLPASDINDLTDLVLTSSLEQPAEYFTVVRHPFARLVSVYKSYFEDTGDDFLYADYLLGILPRSLTFAEFVQRIACIPDWLKDQHFRPQHIFLQYYQAHQLPVRVFKLEEPAPLIAFLQAHGLTFPHLNATEKGMHWEQYYDEVTAKIVQQLYENDLKTFGYEAPGPLPKTKFKK